MIQIIQNVIFEGKVQGVGFRYCTKELAKGYEVTGWIKNQPTGVVEMAVKGKESEVHEFLTAINKSEVAKHIKKTTISEHKDQRQTYTDFRIIT